MKSILLLLVLSTLGFAKAWGTTTSDFTGFDPTSPYNRWDADKFMGYYFWEKGPGTVSRNGRTYSFQSEPTNHGTFSIDTDFTSDSLGVGELYDFSMRIDVSCPVEKVWICIGAEYHTGAGDTYVSYFKDYYYLNEGTNYIYCSEAPIPQTGWLKFYLMVSFKNLEQPTDFSISDITWIKHSENDIEAPDSGGCDLYDDFEYNGYLYQVTSYANHEAAFSIQTGPAEEIVKVDNKVSYKGQDFTVTSIASGALEGNSLRAFYLPSSINTIGYSTLFDVKGLEEIHCASQEPPYAMQLTYERNIKLYVPVGTKQKYAKTYPWNEYIISEEYPWDAEVEYCEAPEITYADGSLHFYSPTPDATYFYNIVVDDSTTPDLVACDGTVPLSATYKVTAYAKAGKSAISKPTIATLCWLDADPQLSNPIVTQAQPVLIKNNGDEIVVEGVNAGERIDFFNMDGILLGTTTASDAPASFVSTENVIIVKIGNQSIKVAK